jgi:hypothetical protein
MIRLILALLVLACCCPTHASDKHKQQRQKLNRRIERLEKRLRALERQHEQREPRDLQQRYEWWRGREGDPWRNPTSEEMDRMCPRPDEDFNLYGVS